jgi:predicted MFS family arabinose efflux permease
VTEKHYHAAAGITAAAIAAGGNGMIIVSSTAYQTECQPSAAASLVAMSGFLRNVGSAIAAAIVGPLVDGMGYGWCLTGLALLDGICVVGLLFIRIRGQVYRERLAEGLKKS